MEPVTSSLIAGVVAAALSEQKRQTIDEAVFNLYKKIKHAIKEKFDISDAVEDLEADPDSEKHQQILDENLATQNAANDPLIIQLTQQLVQALEASETGRKAMAKYHINASASSVGVIGDGARIEGGIHFHHYHGSEDRSDQNDTFEQSGPGLLHDDNDPWEHTILHLSDLHFGTKENAELWHGQLTDDLKEELGCDQLDAIIITGDVARSAEKEEYDAAKVFIDRVCEEFELAYENCLIVPGNNDLNWEFSKKGYKLVDKEDFHDKVREGEYIPVSEDVLRIKVDDVYEKRFSDFSHFYNEIMGEPYPLEHERQGIIYYLKDMDLLILGLNSAYRLDHYYKNRVSICPDALSNALGVIRKNPDYANSLKFAIWHHPLNGPDQHHLTDHGFMERLAKSGFRVCFHGHMHKSVNDLFRYDQSPRGHKIEIVGAGTFGTPIKDWYEGYPLQYNLLKICQKKIIVETRCRTEIDGAWGPHSIWTQGPGQDPLPRYAIHLDRSSQNQPEQTKKLNKPPVNEKNTLHQDVETAESQDLPAASNANLKIAEDQNCETTGNRNPETAESQDLPAASNANLEIAEDQNCETTGNRNPETAESQDPPAASNANLEIAEDQNCETTGNRNPETAESQDLPATTNANLEIAEDQNCETTGNRNPETGESQDLPAASNANLKIAEDQNCETTGNRNPETAESQDLPAASNANL
ncbi:MAG: hypothetical protein GY874_00285, partial [Desulfobacteraceae bacterium]|nr:hypothetical protein [Desulfobacteraceae bacterium]